MARWKAIGGRLGLLPSWLLLPALCWSASSLSAQDLPLKRGVPGSGPYQCPAIQVAGQPGPDEERLARQLASTAAQAVILGDLERARSLLDQATQLDPSSADLAYRRARVLEDLKQRQAAVTGYCKVLAVDSLAEGTNDARQRIEAVMAAERATIPEPAIAAFRQGLTEVDAGRLGRALASFDSAATQAPNWPEAVYDRGVVLSRTGRAAEAARDLGRYLELEPDAPDALPVTRRVGELQSLAVASPPNPGAVLFLGMIVPGMGQFYSGRALEGLGVLSLAGGAVAAGLLIKKVDVRCLTDPGPGGTCPPDQIIGENVRRPYLTASIGAAAAISLVGAVTAFIAARGRRNAQHRGGVLESPAGVGLQLLSPSVSWRGAALDIALIRVALQ